VHVHLSEPVTYETVKPSSIIRWQDNRPKNKNLRKGATHNSIYIGDIRLHVRIDLSIVPTFDRKSLLVPVATSLWR